MISSIEGGRGNAPERNDKKARIGCRKWNRSRLSFASFVEKSIFISEDYKTLCMCKKDNDASSVPALENCIIHLCGSLKPLFIFQISAFLI